MKKRFLTALVAMFALCLALVGCGGRGSSASSEPAVDPKQAFIGTWEIVNMVEDGKETTEEDLAAIKNLGLNVYLELNENGTASLELFGEAMEGTWDATEEGKGSVSVEDQAIPMTLENDQVMLTQEDASLTFKKIDPSEKVSVAAPVADEDDADEDSEITYFGGDSIDDLKDVTELSISLVDDDLATIKVIASGDYYGDPGFLFELTNKTDQDVTFVNGFDDWTVDGEGHSFVLYETLHAGETLDSIGWFDASEVGNDASALSNITGTILLVNASDVSDVLDYYEVSF